MSAEREKQILDAFHRASIGLKCEGAEALARYYELLVKKNEVMNLTAIIEFNEVLTKHFLDSAYLLPLLRDNGYGEEARLTSFLDVGSGAGFPGLVLKIAEPGAECYLLDALRKRVNFLAETAETLGLSSVFPTHGRSEDLAKKGSVLRERFPLVVSRAVAALPLLSEWCLPFTMNGGLFCAYKGNAQEEVKEALPLIRELGGEIENVISYTLPGTDYSREMVVVRKKTETPPRYPRKPGKAGKFPR